MIRQPLVRITSVLAAVVLLSSLPAGAAAERPERYSDRVRFQPGEHPRIWITQADLPALRERIAPGGSHHREFQRLRDLIDQQVEIGGHPGPLRRTLYDPVSLAFVYQMTGERKYANAARERIMEGGANKYLGVALDWIMVKTDLDQADGEPVTREQLEQIARVITTDTPTFHFYTAPVGRSGVAHNPFISPWRYRIPGTIFTSLALLNAGIDDERFAETLHWCMDWFKNEWILATETHSRGIYYGGLGYYGYSSGSEARAALAWRMASGEDLFEESIQLREFIRHVFYQRCSRTGLWVYFENGQGGTRWDRIMPIYSYMLRDPVVRGMAQLMENRYTPESFWDGNIDYAARSRTPRLWERILWYDPEVPVVNLEEIPTAAHWPANGYSSFRSGWEPDDTMLVFMAGDHVNEHQRYQQGHFSISRKGLLATTSGCWSGGSGTHDGNYGNRTIAGNCLLVHDPEEIFWGGYGGFGQRANDGGQYVFATGAIAWGGDWRQRQKDDIHDVAQTVAFESQPLFDYVAGDMTNAYRRELKDEILRRYADQVPFEPTFRPNKLTRATRQIVYLKPELFVICDRVDSTDPSFTKTWLLHTMDEPAVHGERLAELPDEGATEYDATLFTAEHGEGKLIVQRLLPERAVVRKRGGEGFEHWADGRNWPTPSGRFWSWEHGSRWRIETDTVDQRLDDVFLHVLYATDRGTDNDAMPAAELIERGEDPGVRVEYQGRVYEVIFQRGGGRECGGHINIAEGDNVLVDRPLAREVVPTF